MANLPSNIIGEIKKIGGEIDGEAREATEWKTRHLEGIGNNRECEQISIFNNELILWHKTGLMNKNEIGSKVPMGIDEWIKANRPQTWSPILDHWLNGFEAAYKLDLQSEGALLDYLIRYNTALIQKRKSKAD